MAAQLNVGLVRTLVAVFAGDGLDGFPGVGQTVVKLQIGPDVELPQLFLAMTFQ